MLRAIEREPATAPQALGALRSLERMRQRFAAQWLMESRKLLATDSLQSEQLKTISPSDNQSMNSHVPPQPISELLHQLYDE
jgi:hypothetical protein